MNSVVATAVMSENACLSSVTLGADARFMQIGPWQICDEANHESAESALARDVTLGIEVAHGAPATLRIWQNTQALVVSLKDARHPNYAFAKQVLERDGWPLVPRPTGGSAVPQGPGSLQLSMLLPRSKALAYSLADIYRSLCHPLQLALGRMGIETVLGSVPGAFCDGRFNLVVAGKKIAGTAQAWRANIAEHRTQREGYVLAHASLFVTTDTRLATGAVNRFYQLLGCGNEFRDDAVTTVRECLNPAVEFQYRGRDLVQGVRRLLVDACTQAVTD